MQISRTPYSLLIAWNVPRANGSAICAYHIEVGTDSGLVPSHVIKVGATETQHTIPDLKPSTMYRLAVLEMARARASVCACVRI